MRATANVTNVAEYDLLDDSAEAKAIESYFRKPLATWDPGILEPGEREAIARAFVRSADTRRIEIDRADRVVWVTYGISIELEYSEDLLEYYGTTLEGIIQAACAITFPLDERVVDYVTQQSTFSLT